MATIEIITVVTIHLIIPLAGFLYFLWLIKQMKKEGIPNAPIIELFMVLVNYGGVFLIILTSLFWKWSGLASLGVFYLVLVAPIVMGIIAFIQRRKKTISKYHKWAYILGLAYFLIIPVTTLCMFLAGRN